MNKNNKNSNENKEEKDYNAALSVAITSGAASMISLITYFYNPAAYLPVLTGSALIIAPLTYFGIKKLNQKLDKFHEKNMHGIAQLSLMAKEEYEKDRIITKMTVSFIDEIYDKLYDELTKQDVTLTDETIYAINQFLYLINCNYFERITPNDEKFDREDLINHLLTQISAYFQQTKTSIFDEKTAKEVLKRDFLFSDDLTKEIYKEFKKSKSKFGHVTLYHIIRNDIGSTIEEYQSQKDLETGNKYIYFDITEENDYKSIIKQFEQSDYFLENGLGDPRGLDWDIDFLQTIITTIVRDHRQELRKTIPNYQNIHLADSFISNAMVYAVLNHKTKVHKEELLNTFKGWDYLPFEMSLQVLDTIYEENNLDPATHPLRTKPFPQGKVIKKVLQFPGTNKNKSE